MSPAESALILLRKGHHDQYAMNRLSEDPLVPDEIIGFHAQQAVEKLIKAVLTYRGVDYQRTHKLRRLIALLRKAEIAFPPKLTETVALTPFAVELRHDLPPMQDDAARPFDRQWARQCVLVIADWATSIVTE